MRAAGMVRGTITVLALGIGLWGPAVAAPLDDETCKTFETQQRLLESQGLQADLAKGIDAARTELAASRLELVKHYIYLKEQVAFRCPSLLVVSVPELAEPEAQQPLAAAAPSSSSKKKSKRKKKSAEGTVPPPPKKATVTQ
ncbi:MAG: hypothetical protein R3D57_09750 [Hyphomicrobiaceae bacterium]